jgi:hypothetical protein
MTAVLDAPFPTVVSKGHLPVRRGPAERNALVEQWSGLPIWVACRFYPQLKGQDRSDLISEGYLNLLRAAELWDESRDIKFTTYAVRWIRHFTSARWSRPSWQTSSWPFAYR